MFTVKLFANFRDGRWKEKTFDESQFPNPQSVCEALDIQPQEVGILLINGFHSKFDDPLKEGDLLSLFPPVAGG